MFDCNDDDAYLSANGVHPMLADLLTKIIESKPDNVVDFAIQHLIDTFPAQAQRYQQTAMPPPPPQLSSSRLQFSMIDESMMEPEESFLIEDSAPAQPMLPALPNGGFARRGSISATPIKANERRTDQVAVFAKTQQDIDHLVHDVLPKLWVTCSLDQDQSHTIAMAFEPLVFHCGDKIVQKGEPASSYFVLETGSAESSDEEYTAGMGFGELALLYNLPYSDTVEAMEDGTKCWRLDRDTFRLICMKGAMDRRDRNLALLSNISVLQQALSQADLTTLADALQTKSPVKQDEDVCTQGMPGTEFYIVESGMLHVLGEDGQIIDTLKEGDYFGEWALLPRSTASFATVRVASEECKLLFVKRSVFFRTLSSAKSAYPAMEQRLQKYNKCASVTSNRSPLKRKLKQSLLQPQQQGIE